VRTAYQCLLHYLQIRQGWQRYRQASLCQAEIDLGNRVFDSCWPVVSGAAFVDVDSHGHMYMEILRAGCWTFKRSIVMLHGCLAAFLLSCVLSFNMLAHYKTVPALWH